MDVAVLGLGRMGRAIATRLVVAGHEVRIWNRSDVAVSDLTDLGAVRAQSVADAVNGADIVLSSLAADDAVRTIFLPGDQPIPELTGVLVDCSTVSPELSRELGRQYKDRFVASPIAGAPPAVEAGTALLIVAGSSGAVDRATPVLADLSTTQRNAGTDPGAAANLKLIMNYLLLTGVAMLADVVSVARKAGFDDATVSDLLKNSAMVAPGLHNRVNSLIGHEHEGWFSVELGIKDVRLFGDLAGASGARLGLLDAVLGQYTAASQLIGPDPDITAVVETLC